MAMSKEQAEAMLRGRLEAKAVRRYLEALGRDGRGRRSASEATLLGRVEAVTERLRTETDVMRRLALYQERFDASSALASLDGEADFSALEEAFVASVAAYSERKGVAWKAWREAGVSAKVLRRGGLTPR